MCNTSDRIESTYRRIPGLVFYKRFLTGFLGLRCASRLVFFIAILMLFAAPGAESQTLHLIVMASTNDNSPLLREGLAETGKYVQAEMQEVAKALNLNLREAIVDGDDVNVVSLWNIVENLQPNSNDIVFFFYTGHGINKPDIDQQWPQLSFAKSTEDRTVELVSFSEIINKLENKKPRLLIGVAEACNAISGETEYFEDEILGLASLSLTERDVDRLKDLYLYSDGKVLASSSEPGQKSYVSSKGGYFSSSFVEVHKELTSLSDHADWKTLLEKTKSRTQTLGGLRIKKPRLQVPQYMVDVRGRQRDFAWKEHFADKTNIYTQQPGSFIYQHQVQQQQFLVAKIVFFANRNRVFFVMPDNLITEYHPYTGLQVVGFRAIALQPQNFQWDVVSYYNPYQYNRWGVDYFGRIMEWHPQFGWQMVGVAYY